MRPNLPNTYHDCYHLARSAAIDAANRRMRKAGRFTWNQGDSSAYCREHERVMRALGVPDQAAANWQRAA